MDSPGGSKSSAMWCSCSAVTRPVCAACTRGSRPSPPVAWSSGMGTDTGTGTWIPGSPGGQKAMPIG
eukprot:scaffold566_cov115-Isochrysis_galbana.AAC.3